MRANPFYELYLADSIPARDYVALFSPFLIPHVQQVFLRGNVVVVGGQGAGKSMLLALLRHQTRFKYHEAGVEFPVPPGLRRFITCSVNLTHSGATDFGNRRWEQENPEEVAFLFGDFVGTLLLRSLLQTLEAYQTGPVSLATEVGVSQERGKLDSFACKLAAAGPWAPWFYTVDGFDELKSRVDARLQSYQSFLHFRVRNLDQELRATIAPLGEVLAIASELLREEGAVQRDCSLFVDIDQYEELANLRSQIRADGTAVDYRSTINRAMSRRDARISYRIGSRRHSWFSHGAILGSIGKLESERDYKFVDLDLILQRAENRRTYIFPQFAEDVFSRRMRVSGLASSGRKVSIEELYGKSALPLDKAKDYVSAESIKSIKIDAAWKDDTKERLTALARRNPLSARLGEAWIRQKGDKFKLGVRTTDLPWEDARSAYWRKERIDAALYQIASRNQQRQMFYGKSEICDIANGNILVFISVNQHIWDQYFRSASQQGSPELVGLPEIDHVLQSAGIQRASEHWLEKISEETGASSDRLKFVNEVGRLVRDRLLADDSLSNPGATGLSLPDDELDEIPGLRRFLSELVDYGNITESNHTTKERDRRPRTKWYLSPILCPALRIPISRTKEPIYLRSKEMAQLLKSAGLRTLDHSRRNPSEQISIADLFRG